MANLTFWEDVERRFEAIKDDPDHPLRAEYSSIGWPVGAAAIVPGVITDAPHWRIVGGDFETRRDFEATAQLAVTELGHPSADWWRWLDVLKEHNEEVNDPDDPLFDDEPLAIATPEAVVDPGSIGTIRLLGASVRQAARQQAHYHDGRSMVAINLDRMRIRCGLSPYALADKMGIDKRLCGEHLNGKRRPTPAIVLQYAGLFTALGHPVTADALELGPIG
jgi:hypothetical protein